LEPYGQGNPEPVFLANGVEVLSVRTVGGNLHNGRPGHLKLVLRSTKGGRPADAIGFGMADQPITQGKRMDILYTPGINVWNGNASLQLRLRDVKLH
jgi:single-stranded-DNA-specific exonuclease